MPKTLNSLMKHLRSSGIAIGGSAQKRTLKNMGYYHGYKGYRFAGKASNRLPLTDFGQLAALYDFDSKLKALFYPRVMAIETALKNYTIEAVVLDAGSSSFEDVWARVRSGLKSGLRGKIHSIAVEGCGRHLEKPDASGFSYVCGMTQ